MVIYIVAAAQGPTGHYPRRFARHVFNKS